jgi:hypothetical protein
VDVHINKVELCLRFSGIYLPPSLSSHDHTGVISLGSGHAFGAERVSSSAHAALTGNQEFSQILECRTRQRTPDDNSIYSETRCPQDTGTFASLTAARRIRLWLAEE